MTRRTRLSRRTFLQTTAVAASTLGFPAILRAKAPSERLNVAVIGCGGRGGHNFGELLKLNENVVALCDVNERNLDTAAEKAPGAKKFRDFRKLYDALGDNDFDAVAVSTTEHTHAFATLPALRRKKHVYCEKPLTRNVREARLVTEVAAAAGVATQMGTQIHASDNYRRVVELVQSGAVGPIREVHVWVSRAWGWQSQEDAEKNKDLVWTMDRPTGEEAIPPELDWDLWIGPAPYRPFNKVYFPGPKWYRWWDFANGTMSDLGSHWIDLPFWALKLDAPKSIEAAGPAPHPELAPASMQATYEYGARGDMPPVKLTWYQGTMKPTRWTKAEIPQWSNGVLFIGDKGMLLADYGRKLLMLDGKFDFVVPSESIPKSLGHHAEWVHACKTGAPTTCNFAYSGPLTEANHLGNVAFRAGKKILWDSKNLKIPNAPEAEQYLGGEYRKGWTL